METREIAASFDVRASSYARNDWHRRCAERLVTLCQLRAGGRVLDAGTGTGFAAIAVAREVGIEGRVCGVDVSPGMLRAASVAVSESGLRNVELLEADACCLPQYGALTFDAIVCAAGLLYMPVAAALREWHRLLKTNGVVAFSTMRAGSPPGGRIFRECAAEFGVALRDPSEPLGSTSACERALEEAGFQVADIISESVELSAQDLSMAWESNVRSAAHADVLRLSHDRLQALQLVYVDAIAREERQVPGMLGRADVLYAVGRR